MNTDDQVHVEPLADWMRKTRYRPVHPPIFCNDNPGREQIGLALALIDALDAESQAWYATTAERLRERLASDPDGRA